MHLENQHQLTEDWGQSKGQIGRIPDFTHMGALTIRLQVGYRLYVCKVGGKTNGKLFIEHSYNQQW